MSSAPNTPSPQLSDPVAAANLADIPSDRGLAVDVNGEKILLVRDGDAIRAFEATCPHAGAPLDEGAVCNGHIVCPWHKGTFAIADGSLVEPPPLRALKRYEVCLDGDNVHIGAELTKAPHAATPPDSQTALIAGAGAAAAAAAAALREFGFAGRIVVAGPEPGPPYDRTSLSKFVLAGEMPLAELPPLLPENFRTTHRIDRVTAEITRLDAAQKRATFADGATLDFTTALIATGGAPARPNIPGTDLPGVHVLRSRADAEKILADIHAGAKIVILGASFIGLEAASGLRAQNCDVTVIAPEDIPFARQFGPEIGTALRNLHEDHGVQFHLGTQAARLEGEARVTTVVLENGAHIPAEAVLLATGVKPAVHFVHGLPLEKDGGLTADAQLRVGENIYAAGDIVHFPLPHGGNARIEHWRVAQQHARIAAANMAGGNASYAGVPYFWTYHYGQNIEYLGHAGSWDNVVIEGDPAKLDFLALLCTHGMVQAAIAGGRERATAVLIEAMRAPISAVDALKLCTGIR